MVPNAKQDYHRHEKELGGFLDADPARWDGTPGLVDLVLKYARRKALVGDGYHEDVEPDPETSDWKVDEDCGDGNGCRGKKISG